MNGPTKLESKINVTSLSPIQGLGENVREKAKEYESVGIACLDPDVADNFFAKTGEWRLWNRRRWAVIGESRIIAITRLWAKSFILTLRKENLSN